MTDQTTRCDASYSKRHQPHYDNGAIQFTDLNRLEARCQHCGLSIRRIGYGSAWWHSIPLSETPANDR